jgi:hypothetical protein
MAALRAGRFGSANDSGAKSKGQLRQRFMLRSKIWPKVDRPCARTNWRALMEADIGRWKRVIGHALRSQTDKRQATEVAIAVDVLNRMLELGRPSYVRIA